MKKLLLLIAFIAFPQTSDAAISFVASTSVQFNAVSSFAIDVPSVLDNDLLYCFVNNSANSGALAYPTSWDGCNTATIYEQDDYGGSNAAAAYKIAASEGASYTWTYAVNRTGAASISAFRGVDTTSPFQEDADEAGTADPHVTPAILPDQDNSILIGAIFFDPSAGNTCTVVAGFPLAVQVTNDADATHCIAYRIQTTATSEGVSIDPNNDGTSSWGEVTSVFRAAAGGGGVSTSVAGIPIVNINGKSNINGLINVRK